MVSEATDRSPGLEVRLLGPLEVWRDGERLPLPRSKKTRALLAYLVTSGRAHTREQLCTLLWDATYDPRGDLRWSLSKLRSALGDDAGRIEADRRRVAFVAEGVAVDLTDLRAGATGRIDQTPTEELERLATLARGAFLEDLELPDLFDFQAWCIGHRESAREQRCAVLAELVHRLRDDPDRALPHARSRARVDSLDVAAHLDLLQLLLRTGRREEAEQQHALARGLLREAHPPSAVELDRRWRELVAQASAVPAPVPAVPPADASAPDSHGTARSAAPNADGIPFVGREEELRAVEDLLARATTERRACVAILAGEPGAGKSLLADRIAAAAHGRGVTVLAGRAYEAERSRPFGPWLEALPDALAGLAGLAGAGADQGAASREELFASVAGAVTAMAQDGPGALLVLDDVQWLDADSAQLLHVVVRSAAEAPLRVLLLARSGELEDNDQVREVLRGLRREADVERIDLGPLTLEEIAALVAPFPDADAGQVHAASAGNPLYALELARAAADGATAMSASLTTLVQERVERLPPRTAELLRWAAALGHSVDVARLERLADIPPDDLVDALEQLEQRSLLHATDDGRVTFAHDVVRQAVYAELSQPRRRLMHRQVARELAAAASDDPEVATELAHHAGLAGEAELGVRACIDAGLRALRLFANGEAEVLALRGLDLAANLDEADRIAATLDLLHIKFSARTPDRDQAADEVHELATRALDLGLTRAARLGFQTLSFLRWESSSMADAHANILQAERVSRAAEGDERAAALGQAARCLVLLERNLNQAEAFVLEAEALTATSHAALSSVQFAQAMLHEHRGELDRAAEAFRDSRWTGREQGDRLAEFRALQNWTMLEIDRGALGDAAMMAKELVTIGQRVREGSEGPSGRALQALVQLLQTDLAGPRDALDEACAELRVVDAKYPLAFVLTRLARAELAAGDAAAAAAHAAEGLELATAIGRPSEVALSRIVLAGCAEAGHQEDELAAQLAELEALDGRDVSAAVREELAGTLQRAAAGG